MHSHSEIRHSRFTPAQLYALVIDIERYPEFLPWCRAARIVERHTDYFLGELIISFSHLTERYTSKVVGDPKANIIEVELIRGPFTTLSNHWKFVPSAQGGTDIHFAVEFEFRSKLLNTLIGGVFGRAVDKMGDAFIARANQLYG